MRELLYKLKWRCHHPQAFKAWERIVANEQRPLVQLWAAQEEARRRIVRHAMMNTVFYSRHYDKAGFSIEDIGMDGWFERLPIVTKKDLREHFIDFVDPSQRQFLKTSTTGGSTGIPTKVGYDGRIPEEIYSWRLQDWFGVNPWDDHAYIWRDTRATLLSKWENAALWWPTRHLKLDASFISENMMQQYLEAYNRLKPTMLQGYVGAVTQLAQYVVDRGIKVHHPQFVWTTSAPLPQSQRNLIAMAFKAPVCDQYGSCELRWIAAQCKECGGLHVNVEHVHIEFADNRNLPVEQGCYGKTLLTNLEDGVFPLIRYENGDRGRWLLRKCACGRTLPMIDSVKGREVETFVLPSGKTINGEFLTTIFDGNPDLVLGFRAVQHKDLSIDIEYIPSSGGECESQIKEVVRRFSNRIGGEVVVRSKRVTQIPHDRGKLRYVVREVV